MLDADPAFRPVRRRDGYLALEDMGLIGDGSTAALVGRDGDIPWLCVPRFDSEPLFCGLLDAARGGGFIVAPDEVVEARQRYEPDTAVLVTELRSPTGLLAVTDALALRPGTDLSDDAPAGRRELIRSAVVLDGTVRVRVEIEPRGGATAQAAAGGLSLDAWRRPDLRLHVRSNRRLESLRTVHELRAGERLALALSWGETTRYHRYSEPEHDVYGEVLDCAYQWVRGGEELDAPLWGRLASLADLAAEAWRAPDQGIWEVRSEGRVFTYSAALCQVALDRAARLAEQLGLPGPVAKWRRAAADLRQTILEDAWDERSGTLTEHIGGAGGLVDVLRSVRPFTDDDVAARTRRARYRGYVHEDGVAPEHGTETFAEVELALDSWRWSGTRFRLGAGKAIGRDRKEVVVHFRPVPHLPFAASAVPNRLRFGLDPEALALELTGTGPSVELSLVPLTLHAEMTPPELPAYGRVLLDVLRGNSALSIRADEAEEPWRVVTPVLEGWARGLRPLEEYAAGSQGP